MLDHLTEKFSGALRKLSGRGRISESNIREAMGEVRTALLEADVHYDVVKKFCDDIVDKAVGSEVLKSLKPGEQMIKIVYDELVQLMGPVDSHIMYVQPAPTIVMMSGLQGSGKTTTCGKLAAYLKKKGKSVMLAAADLQRPAAVEQLRTLAEQVEEGSPGGGAVRFYGEPDKCAEYGKAVGVAVKVCRNALKAARSANVDVLILDTAGRLHVNDDLMGELRQVDKALNPHQIYLVIDAMTGQDAVNSAKAFNEQLELDGVILSKTDSDTRGGAALTVKEITGKPIKFVGTGEKIEALEEFHPDRMASRILGMGDVVSLVEKAQEQVSEEEALKLQEKMESGKMTMDDFLDQLRKIRKMGSMKALLGMLPGVGQQLKDLDMNDGELDRTEAMINSMTRHERKDVDLLDQSRRRRVATGSGVEPKDVSQLVKGFDMVQNMTKQMAGMGALQRMRALGGLGKQDLAAMGGSSGPSFKTRQRSKRKKKDRKRKSR
ncbi:signal recognition particle protein [Planctomycetales bacterium ZRK34]|nr:signal recognition particle protein [Planctomycetales bacterium ZRK34]